MVINNCTAVPILPLVDAGATSIAYTVTTDKNSPSPTPAIHRPTNNCGNALAEHAIALPTANTAAPSEIVLVREILSDKGPDATEAREAVMRIEDTMRPCTVGEMPLSTSGANWAWKVCMVVTGPMLPVSKPKRNPPMAVNATHHT